MAKVDVLLGLQWGDEGKGKFTDLLSEYDIFARFQGGPNAGHTIVIGEKKHVLHMVPSGVFNEGTINLLGGGMVIDLILFKEEVESLQQSDPGITERLLVCQNANIIIPTHRLLDGMNEKISSNKIGTTKKGIGPAYTDRTQRKGLRIGDLFSIYFKEKYYKLRKSHEQLLHSNNCNEEVLSDDDFFAAVDWFLESGIQVVYSGYYLRKQLSAGKKVLAEGAQGTMLDINHSTYPFVTSSNVTIGGVCTGLGISTKMIGKVIGIAKAYTTRVGEGPFPTELRNSTGDRMKDVGCEYGSTTGRPRRCGWLDMVVLKHAVQTNGVDEIILTKADVLAGFESLKVCVAYRDEDGNVYNDMPFDLSEKHMPVYKELPGWGDISDIRESYHIPIGLTGYIKFIEETLGVPINIVSVGPERDQNIKTRI